MKAETETEESEPEVSDTEPQELLHENELEVSESRDVLNSTLIDLDLSPLKLHAVPVHMKVGLGKRKLQQANSEMSKRVATMLNVEQKELSSSNDTSHTDVSKEIYDKANDMDRLIQLMKEKMLISNKRQKIQILTLTPESWSLRKTAKEFHVSKTTAQKARKLREEKGIIEIPPAAVGKKLDKSIVDAILQIYHDDEFTRQLPGKKDYVSISKNVHMPKRLILCNLKELHAAFKSKHPDKKVSFSKFASLRPKWCISVGPKGTHSVCVCTIHQNVKLMLSAVTLSKDYHELIDIIVCDRTSKECMVHRCESCPGVEVLKGFIEGELLLNDDEDETENNDNSDSEDDDDEKNITFKQWTTCDRSELITCSLPLEDFIAKLCDLLNDITFHSYIAKAQAAYLKKVKENLKSNEVIVLGDFAENHTFLVQDEIQGYHWNNQQCTLHPVVLYYRKDVESDVTSRSICFISNDLKHDVNLVYKVIKDTIS